MALLALISVEMKAKHPIIAPDLFRSKVFVISVAASFFIAAGMFGAILYVVVFAQDVIGVSATSSGLVLLPMMLGLIIGSVVAGQIISRTRRYKVITILGVMTVAISMFLFSRLSPTTTEMWLQVRMAILGLGLGVSMPAFTIIVQSAFNSNRLGAVTAGVQLSRGVGATVGATLLGTILSGQLNSHLLGIENDMFINALKQVTSGQGTVINANWLQEFVNPQSQAHIREFLSQLVPAQQSILLPIFDNSVNIVKAAFSSSLNFVFLIDAILVSVALVLVIFLPKIEVRSTNQSPWESYMESRWPIAGDQEDVEPRI